METSLLGRSVQGFSLPAYCLAVDLCICSHLLQEMLLRQWLSNALTYEYSRMFLKVISLLRSFSRRIAFVFILGLDYLVPRSHPRSVGYGSHIVGWTLRKKS